MTLPYLTSPPPPCEPVYLHQHRPSARSNSTLALPNANKSVEIRIPGSWSLFANYMLARYQLWGCLWRSHIYTHTRIYALSISTPCIMRLRVQYYGKGVEGKETHKHIRSPGSIAGREDLDADGEPRGVLIEVVESEERFD